jgi:hypothetical protein
MFGLGYGKAAALPAVDVKALRANRYTDAGRRFIGTPRPRIEPPSLFYDQYSAEIVI